MNKDKICTTEARYLDILFPWDDELCKYEPTELDDVEKGLIPMVSNGYWHGIIDLKEHILLNCTVLPYNLQAKVRDAGVYTLLDEEKNPICNYRGYVPTLPFDDNSWSDYIHMFVSKGNIIDEWRGEFDLDGFTDKATPMTNDEYNILLLYSLKKFRTYPTKSEVEMLEQAFILWLTYMRDR